MPSTSAIEMTGDTHETLKVTIKPGQGNKAHTVIVGGGPAGLLTALLLAKQECGNITIVEPRFGQYVRSGYYINEVFEELEAVLGEPIPRSYGNHIKDVERALYAKVKANKSINCVHGQFTGYSAEGVHVLLNRYELDYFSDSEDSLEPKKIQVKPNADGKGYDYRVLGLDGKTVESGVIPWSQLPENPPKKQKDILLHQAELLPSILKFTSNAKHTHRNDEEKGGECIIPGDMLLDCTGTKGLVIDSVNDQQSEGTVFERSVIGPHPNPRHLHATILLGHQSYPHTKDSATPLEEFERRKKLKKLGWNYWELPYGYLNYFGTLSQRPPENWKPGKPVKYHFYSEIPDTLEDNQVLDWIKACFYATSGIPIESMDVSLTSVSRKYPLRKHQYDLYPVQCQETHPYFYFDNQNKMVIVPLGDAAFNNLFYFGKGLRRAVNEITALASSIKVNKQDNQVDISFHDFVSKVAPERQEIKAMIESKLEKRRNELRAGENNLNKFYENVQSYLNKYANPNTKFTDPLLIEIEKQLENNFASLILLTKERELNKDTEDALFQMANHCMKLGDYMKDKNKFRFLGDTTVYYKKAQNYYNKALEIYSAFTPPQFALEGSIESALFRVINKLKYVNEQLGDKSFSEIKQQPPI